MDHKLHCICRACNEKRAEAEANPTSHGFGAYLNDRKSDIQNYLLFDKQVAPHKVLDAIMAIEDALRTALEASDD